MCDMGRIHPPAHFHVRYGAHKAIMTLEPLMILEGELPPRALGLVMEWAAQHRAELQENWERARNLQELLRIAPLE